MYQSKRIHPFVDKIFRNIHDMPKIIMDTIPSINIFKKDNHYKIDVGVPGVTKNDLKIDVDGNILTISCERETTSKSTSDPDERIEYDYSSFSRSLTVPEDADYENINAKYENGVLTLVIPKKEQKEKPKGKKINVD